MRYSHPPPAVELDHTPTFEELTEALSKLKNSGPEFYERMLVLVDLKKAYDSVPRQALWSLLEKYGVPPTMLLVIRSLHNSCDENWG